MYSKLQLAYKYLQYYLTALNGKGHGVHSPFIFDFIENVLNDHRHFYIYDQVERLREQLINDNTVLEVEDFGAGSVTGASAKRTVSSIARNAAKSAKWGQFLFRLVNHYKPERVLELGTSLGLSTSYLAAGNPQARMVTLEGSKQVAAVASKTFEQLGLESIQQVTGNFDETLPFVLKDQNFDLIFIDGNHRKQPTLNYFRLLLTNIPNEAIMIFDDIHWSREMEEAWMEICSDEKVRVSIDLFFMGMVVFRDAIREKQDYRIRF
jgi:predicted O-methyltransferase YrrM